MRTREHFIQKKEDWRTFRVEEKGEWKTSTTEEKREWGTFYVEELCNFYSLPNIIT